MYTLSDRAVLHIANLFSRSVTRYADDYAASFAFNLAGHLQRLREQGIHIACEAMFEGVQTISFFGDNLFVEIEPESREHTVEVIDF